MKGGRRLRFRSRLGRKRMEAAILLRQSPLANCCQAPILPLALDPPCLQVQKQLRLMALVYAMQSLIAESSPGRVAEECIPTVPWRCFPERSGRLAILLPLEPVDPVHDHADQDQANGALVPSRGNMRLFREASSLWGSFHCGRCTNSGWLIGHGSGE
jgi:hypothetical protein